jgi:hypothetical protein
MLSRNLVAKNLVINTLTYTLATVATEIYIKYYYRKSHLLDSVYYTCIILPETS